MLARTSSLVPVARKALTLNGSLGTGRKEVFKFAEAPAITTYNCKLARYAHHGPPADYKYPTMDDMLVPCGSWQEHYDNMQRKYNIHLLLGVGCLTIALAVGKYSGALDLYMGPPERPAPRKP